jgi:hypothetical protein
MEVSVQLYAPAALPSAIDATVPLNKRMGWFSELVCMFWRTDKSYAAAGSQIRIHQLSVQWLSYYTDRLHDLGNQTGIVRRLYFDIARDATR